MNLRDRKGETKTSWIWSHFNYINDLANIVIRIYQEMKVEADTAMECLCFT